ncbi:hypothetical protein C1Y63_01535 [Corynebacterium sp. 13CS0277]|uniref:trypsin-like serine protease n=1 Tax=Corynebacterium sp. 13CS0277 TaxID=2071994 RepID=UPI000D032AE9|nr:trypsin-like serine protease [Corynebacterium sp. 13CS0277]PRQ12269.1 hypothetical protein C1Y63_01535 [Corynebacterium sp. 13CS0277]
MRSPLFFPRSSTPTATRAGRAGSLRAATAAAVLATTAALGATAAPAEALVFAAPVIGGIAAQATAAVQLGNSTCTATLISPEWLLTARHCVGEGNFSAITVGNTAAGEKRFATDVIISPHADLAVVKMNAPVAAQPARLATFHPTTGQRGVIAGWGKSALVAKETQGIVGSRFLATEDMVTTPGSSYLEVTTTGGRLVHGDSGGPLYMGDEVVAVASMANTSAPAPQAGLTGWYVPVAEHLDWIHRQTGIPVAAPSNGPIPLRPVLTYTPGQFGSSFSS